MKNNIKPIFIFCLPRSGSTLLQRILMGHSKISSIAEPHFLLPFIFAAKKEGTLTKYSHSSTYKGINDMINNLPEKENEYYQYLNDFSSKIYSSLSDCESVYFLDKTPRYFWVIPEIAKIFPEAKFVFLFRNPVQIFASIVSTISNKRFNNIYGFYRYMVEGIDLLSDGYKLLQSNSYKINYDDILLNSEESIKGLTSFLELEYEEDLLKSFKDQIIKGSSKDPTGIEEYDILDATPLEKWKKIFNTRFRKRLVRKYIENLSEESLYVQGYNKREILNEIKLLKTNGKYNLFLDIKDYYYMKFVLISKINFFFSKNLKWIKGHYLN
jgi:hypothetical protein